MAGSPKKRARREAKRLAALQAASASEKYPIGQGEHPEVMPAPVMIVNNPIAAPAPIIENGRALPMASPQNLQGEILPPVRDEDVTRTALKRAMRRKAAEHAEEAIEVLVANMRGKDAKLSQDAADKILKAAGVNDPDTKNAAEGLVVQILKMAVE